MPNGYDDGYNENKARERWNALSAGDKVRELAEEVAHQIDKAQEKLPAAEAEIKELQAKVRELEQQNATLKAAIAMVSDSGAAREVADA